MTTAIASSLPNRVKTRLPEGAHNPGSQPLATFLGLFSIGLGLAEVLKPRAVADATGVRYPGILRAYGLREIAAGVGILSTDRPAFWLWSRVAGDVMDLAAAYANDGGRDRSRVMQAAAAVAGVTALDVLCACEHSRQQQ